MATKTKPRTAEVEAVRPGFATMVWNSMVQNLGTLRQRLASITTGGRRDIDKECDYPTILSKELLGTAYDRNGVVARIVNIFPMETWKTDPCVYDGDAANEETAFDLVWKSILDVFNIWHYLERADILSGIGRFGVILLGVDDGLDPKEEAVTRAGAKLTFLRVFDERRVSIIRFDTDLKSPRYGLPQMYRIQVQDPHTAQAGSGPNDTGGATSTTFQSIEVHWTRVVHFADNRESSEWAGKPRAQLAYNRAADIYKILGANGEGYWQCGVPGFSMETQPGVENFTFDEEATKEQVDAYLQGLQRVLFNDGTTMKPLTVNVPDPGPHVETHVRIICLGEGIPYRIFLGSEEAKLASVSDTKNWNSRIKRRQNRYVIPMVIRPFVDRLIGLGVLPEPENQTYRAEWEDPDAPSAMDKAELASKITDCLSRYVASGVNSLIPELEYLTLVLGWDKETAESVLEVALMNATDRVNSPLDVRRATDTSTDANVDPRAAGSSDGASGESTNPNSQGASDGEES